jgi:hypothetical protein
MAEELAAMSDNDLEALLNSTGLANAPEDDEKPAAILEEEKSNGGGDTSGIEKTAAELKAEIARVREDILKEQREKDYKVMAMMSRMLEQRAPAATESVVPPVQSEQELTDEQKAQLWQLAAQSPKLQEELISRIVDKKLPDMKGITEDVRTSILSELAQKDAGSMLSQTVNLFADDIKEGSSPIMQEAAAIRDMVGAFLDKKFRGTDVHNKIAIALAGARRPDVTSKRFMAQQEASEKAREARIGRLSQLMGGGGRSVAPSEVVLTEKDVEIGTEMGLDMNDKAIRDEYLEHKRNRSGMMIMGGRR